MAIQGALAEQVRSIIPITWDALLNDPRFGESALRLRIDTMKDQLFVSPVDVDDEDTLPLRLLEYTAKLIVIDLVPAGVDFWMNQSTSVVTTGTNESDTFVDRADKLLELREKLLIETRAQQNEVDVLGPRLKRVGRPLLSTLEDELLTPSPQEFGRPYRATTFS